MELIRPDHLSKCTWKLNVKNSPHTQWSEFTNREEILPNILSAIGQTPLVKLNNIPKRLGLQCDLYAKCEFLNPGGSVKDRIAYRMLQDAEDEGKIKPGFTIIEPTSGNTGIGLAMACAVKGYRCIIVMPEKMSDEKASTLHALGAEIVRTPTDALWNSPESHISVAQNLHNEIPDSIILDQYTNCGNPLAHYDQTATEIWRQCNEKVDYLVVGAGTGGTISGIGRKFKEISPETQIIGIDPHGSILAAPHEETDAVFYEVEGIGYDFVPTVLDREIVDKWCKTNDHESFTAARMLIREEGLLCGGSSGAATSVALKIAKDLPAGKRIVILLPDGIRNYMTKFVSDRWMKIKGFLDPLEPIETNKWWWNIPLSTLSLEKPLILVKGTTCEEATKILEKSNQQILVVQEGDTIKGVVSINTITTNLISGNVNITGHAENAMIKQFSKVVSSITLGKLSFILEKEPYVLVFDDVSNELLGVVNQTNVLNFIINGLTT